MPLRRGILLTGTTGLLGRYLWRDLASKGHAVAVLVRDFQREPATERIARIVDFWSERLGRTLPMPVILTGELHQSSLGLSTVDRNWVGKHCRSVIHSAANLSFRNTSDGEPWRTNVDGTKFLLELCDQAGVSDWHYISTAFVCGRRSGRITEDDIDQSPSFHNSYEESKFQAERLVRTATSIRSTIYRPSIIVGDSRTGYTSTYMGLYRFIQLANHLASAGSSSAPDSPVLRLPLSGDELWDLVPVDWVSEAIVELFGKPQWHGRTFHLVSRSPMTTRLIRDVGMKELRLRGIEFIGSETVEQSSRPEQVFRNGIREYWPYLGGNPMFSSDNTREALPDLPAPIVDQPMLERLIRFAVASQWGRRTSLQSAVAQPNSVAYRAKNLPQQPTSRFCCAEYIEQIFPRRANRSRLARQVGLDLTVCFDVCGSDGGQWSCKWNRGELVSIQRGLDAGATVTYRTDAATLQAVVNGLQSPQEAFFEQRMEIAGDMETALKLTVLFGQFLAEEQNPQSYPTDVIDVSSSHA